MTDVAGWPAWRALLPHIQTLADNTDPAQDTTDRDALVSSAADARSPGAPGACPPRRCPVHAVSGTLEAGSPNGAGSPAMMASDRERLSAPSGAGWYSAHHAGF
ncbi:hypothetical protein GCM10010129_43970 [Streptomyces fumigatiscleroticus]|nr:hypothetical protein GCM10010129_43970 [Streptomyces fumigatiscleroticus]